MPLLLPAEQDPAAGEGSAAEWKSWSRYAGVVVFSMNDVPLGFGTAAKSTLDCRKLDPSGAPLRTGLSAAPAAAARPSRPLLVTPWAVLGI